MEEEIENLKVFGSTCVSCGFFWRGTKINPCPVCHNKEITTSEEEIEIDGKNYYGDPIICAKCGKITEKGRSQGRKKAVCYNCQRIACNLRREKYRYKNV